MTIYIITTATKVHKVLCSFKVWERKRMAENVCLIHLGTLGLGNCVPQ